MASENEFDVIIVGSGVAGALTAWKLTQLGSCRILILEAGDNGVSAGQRVVFHHMMDTQGNRGDPFAPYKDLESRKYAPTAENSQRELAIRTGFARFGPEAAQVFGDGARNSK